MKNSSVTIGNRTRDLPACSAVPQPSASLRVPKLQTYWEEHLLNRIVRIVASMCCRIIRLPIGDLRVAGNSVGIATCYVLNGPESNPGAGEIFRTSPDRRWVHPASFPARTGSIPGVKRPRRGVDNHYLSSAQVKDRVELYSYYPSGLSWRVTWYTVPQLVDVL